MPGAEVKDRSPRLDVEPQQVVLGEGEATDWRFSFEVSLGAVQL
jgi:hypothetical protein